MRRSTRTSATTSCPDRCRRSANPTSSSSRASTCCRRRRSSGDTDQLFASDFFDFSIYVDADERDIEQWYVDRFLRLVETVFQDPESYFHRYASLNDPEARATAATIWAEINAPNLRENIQPTRMRAHLILTKGARHVVEQVQLRRV